MHLHPMVYVSHLKAYHEHNNEDMEVDIEDARLYIINKIINSQYFSFGVKYLICWEGYSRDNNIWEPIENLSTNSIKWLLIEFHNALGNKRKAIHSNLESLLA